MEPLISVIVTIYKTENYLRKCLESILKQTYAKLEIILVNDGSPDNCPSICDEYAQKDSRIKVIHKTNGGQITARNKGLEEARGDYITFVDSDDWIGSDLYGNVMQHAPFEVALYGCTYFYPETNTYREVAPCDVPRLLNWKQDGDLAARLVDNSLYGYACNKIYSRRILEGLRFRDIRLREDLVFNMECFSRTADIALVNCSGYFYVQHKGSTLHQAYTGSIPDIPEALEHMTMIHPFLTAEKNREIANRVIKTYLCDTLSKFVFMNQMAAKEATIAVLRKISNSTKITDLLKVYPGDPFLFLLLTVCIKQKVPYIFYYFGKRIWHD